MQLLIVANWKMAPQKITEAQKLAKAIRSAGVPFVKKISLVICAPSIHIPALTKISTALKIGGQSVAGSSDIAQTGLISVEMLKAAGAKYCIVGHSEERARGMTNERVKEQLHTVITAGLIPIFCVGETARDTQGWYLSEVKDQLEIALSGLSRKILSNVVIAYEPVWAIGKDAIREATPAECHEMVIYIRKIVSDLFGHSTGGAVQIIYGGSVDEKNAKRFLTDGGAQGLLIGRASLDVKRFKTLLAGVI